jgi:hypothetical protein
LTIVKIIIYLHLKKEHIYNNKMKNTLLLILLFIARIDLFADQQVSIPNLKFGKPTQEEMLMKNYAPDSTANAVVLCKLNDVEYRWGAEDFQLYYTHKVRIKILKPTGNSYANITIPYYDNKDSHLRKESITQLEANAYNMVDGKIERTKMTKDLIFKERVNDDYMQLKFTIPQAKVGTVLEYEYTLISDFYYLINSWKGQQEIPIAYEEYNVSIPEYFKFNVDMRGTQKLINEQKLESLRFFIKGEQYTCNGKTLIFKGIQVPSLKNDNYVWCSDDYCTQVNLELQGIEFPGSLYKSFTQTWEDIDKILLDDSDFGGRLKMSNPLKNEMAALHLENKAEFEEKVTSIYTLLKSKIRWNGKYDLYGNRSKRLLTEGTGSNADINFVLMSMLRDAGIKAYPIVMSQRSNGILPYAHPSIKKLNTFIVGIAESDTSMVYLDGSVEKGYINILPPSLLVNRARIITPQGNGNWINLESIGKNQLKSLVNASINENGEITGARQTVYIGQYASSFRSKIYTPKDSTEYIAKLADEEHITVKGVNFKYAHSFAPQIQETISFEKQSTKNDNLIYVNPLIFLHVSESPFKQSERKLPIEFPYPEQYSLNVNLMLPNGYVIDEMPKNEVIRTNDQKVVCRYYATQDNNKVTIRYIFSLNKLLFLPEEYPELQNVWQLIAEKNTNMIVLKKI